MDTVTGHKDALLRQVRDALADGTITRDDLLTVAESKAPVPAHEHAYSVSKVLNTADVLFFLAGIILYGALAVAATEAGDQSWISSMVLLIPGLLLWAATYGLARRVAQSEVVKGFINALLLTGSLAVVSGGLLAVYRITSNTTTDATVAYASAAALVVLGGLHLLFDRSYRHPLLVVFGFYLLVAAFPVAMAGALAGAYDASGDIWTLVSMGTGVLLGYGGIVAARTTPGRSYLRGAFTPVGGVIVLGSAYLAAMTSDIAWIWQVILPLLIYSAFYYSIKRRSHHFLVTGSIFLALYLISMAFRYFSGIGASFCLVLSGVGLLVTAFLAITINKRYIAAASGS